MRLIENRKQSFRPFLSEQSGKETTFVTDAEGKQMKIEYDSTTGTIELDHILKLHGDHIGEIRVVKAGVLNLFGDVNGDVIVEVHGEANIYGTVYGNVINKGGRVFVSGTISRHLVCDSGTNEVVPSARIIKGQVYDDLVDG